MAWIPLLTERLTLRQARSLTDAGKFDDALDALLDLDGSKVDAVRKTIRDAAVRHWCAAATRAADRGEGPRARSRLDRARRYATLELRPMVQAVELRLRQAQIRQTKAEHWLPVLDAAAVPTDGQAAAWTDLASRSVVDKVAAAWGHPVDVDAVRTASDAELRTVRDIIAARYPAELVPRTGLGTPFVSATLWLALGRPDVALLPLLESDDREPLVCFELARVAHALGHPAVAGLALDGFVARAGGHHRIHRLHSGVFQAQMALACDEGERAIALFDALPMALIGGRPALIYTRLLLDAGRRHDAAALLDAVEARHPEIDGASTLREEAEAGAPLGAG